MPVSSDPHAELFQLHQPLLFGLAYRLLGSAADAEDVLQNAFLRFSAVPLAQVENPRAFLATVVTRLCLSQLTSARVRRETYVGPWLPEPIATAGGALLPEAQYDQTENISLAFLALLERLSPLERAVFILREVFDYDYSEIAAILDRTEAACRKTFSRAHGFLAGQRPRFQATPEEHQRLLEAFIRAAADGDLPALTQLLADEVTFWADGGGKVKGAALQPVHGREAVARFVLGVTNRFLPPGALVEIAPINGRPTLLIRQADGTPAIVVSVEVVAGLVRGIWAVANPDKLSKVSR